MVRRLSAVLAPLVLVSLSIPAQAAAPVVAKKTTTKLNALYLSHSLRPGHGYRVLITASGHRPITGYVTEYFTYVQHKQFASGSHTLTIRGTTPVAMNFKQPVSQSLSAWAFAATVQLKSGHGITLQILDLGKKR